MPHVQITWVEGRTPEQKRKIAERATQVLIEDGRAKRENIHVAFHDVPATNYAEAGVLGAAREANPRPQALSPVPALEARGVWPAAHTACGARAAGRHSPWR